MENYQTVAHFLPVVLTENHNEVTFWRLPSEIGQSRLGGRKTASHACVFIVVRMAEIIHRKSISIGNHARRACHPTLISVLCNGVLEGNNDHSKFSNDEKRTYIIPDCLKLTNVFKEIDFVCVEDTIDSLPSYLHKIVKSFHLMHLKQINTILISAERAVLLVYERDHDTFLLIDSHSHGQHGAVMAYAKRAHLNEFVDFLKTSIFPTVESKFELSVIYFSGENKPDDCSSSLSPLGSCRIFPKKRRSSEEVTYNPKQAKVC